MTGYARQRSQPAPAGHRDTMREDKARESRIRTSRVPSRSSLVKMNAARLLQNTFGFALLRDRLLQLGMRRDEQVQSADLMR
jgi:hypothetical protein